MGDDTRETLGRALACAHEEFMLDRHEFVRLFESGAYPPDAIRWWAMKMLPGSNRFNQAFLRVASRIEDPAARIILLRNVLSEHGNLDPARAHVSLFRRFMSGIGCARIRLDEDDGAWRVLRLRFKRFEIPASESVAWSLGRFAAIEHVLPSIFTRYLVGLRRVFPQADDATLEYFRIHCELDPEHTAELLDVAHAVARSPEDASDFVTGARDMCLSLRDMFDWLLEHMTSYVGGTVPEDRVTKPASDHDALRVVLDTLPRSARSDVLLLGERVGLTNDLALPPFVRLTTAERPEEQHEKECHDGVVWRESVLREAQSPRDAVAALCSALDSLRAGGVFAADVDAAPNGPHVLDADPHRATIWARLVGFDSVRLFARTSGGLVCVCRRPAAFGSANAVT